MTHAYNAACKCGQLTFQADAAPVVQLTCHCTDCRAVTGNDYSSIAFFKSKSAQHSGARQSHEFVAKSGNKTIRETCTHCATTVFDKSDGFPGLIGVFIDRIQPPFIPNINCHVWVKSKLPAVELPSNLPCYDEGIPSKK